MEYNLEAIEILPAENTAFHQRETGVTHTPYRLERAFYSAIASGDIEKTQKLMSEILEQRKLVVGTLSKDSLRQIQYWAVSCITLAARYAISAGKDETEALNFSDECIRAVDKCNAPDEVFKLIVDKALELTIEMKKEHEANAYPAVVSACIKHIRKNLHTPLRVKELAAKFHTSPDYLSLLFKKHKGSTLSAYIREQKITYAHALLKNGMPQKDVAYYLGYSSESHFIQSYKAYYGKTYFSFQKR